MQIVTMGNAQTMSSREIADLTEKRHDNVMAVCRSLRESGVCPEIKETPYINPQNRQTYDECILTKRDSLILVARLSPEFTARIVDRWQELEARQPVPAELSRMDILKLAMESEQARIKAEEERDHAVKTKAQIGSRREATAMATASAAKAESEKLRDKLGAGTRQASIRAVNGMTGKDYDWLPLRRWCKEHAVTPGEVIDPLYGLVKAWPAAAWMECHRVDLVAMFG